MPPRKRRPLDRAQLAPQIRRPGQSPLAAEMRRCTSVDPVWDRRCGKDIGHDGAHQNDEHAGDTITWGTVEQVRAYERAGERWGEER